MAEALYRKYRPQVFEDVVGQEHIERTIKNAIERDKVSHAYLFTGPRGTGKTTTARLLAKALLCQKGPTPEPDGTCEDCELIAAGEHPDVYELDAASRTGVENVREEIIGRVQFAPTRGRYKIYIIDEVHMLSTAAFNALLKTLEEPPSHVVFILATTDPQKVPETIHSRCQRFDFRRISNESIAARLGAICVAEGVEYEEDALGLIAHRAEGGLRNALTSLEQLIAFGEGSVTMAVAERMLGSLDSSDLAEIVRFVGMRDVAACFKWTAEYVETGSDLAQFTRDFAEHVRNLYVLSLAGAEAALDVTAAARREMLEELPMFGPDRLARLLGVLGDLSAELKTSTNPRLSFEIALTRMVRPESDLTLEGLAARIEELEAKLAHGVVVGAGANLAQEHPAAQLPVRAHENVADVASPREARVVSAPEQMPRVQVEGERPSGAPAQAARGISPNASVANDRMEQEPSPVQRVAAAGVSEQLAAQLGNPAALQRLWQTVLASLKKAKTAYGVLFLNTKAYFDEASGTLIVDFPAENDFAFKAVQKPDVQDELGRCIASACGVALPFSLRKGGVSADAASPAVSSRPAAANEPASRPSAAVRSGHAEPAVGLGRGPQQPQVVGGQARQPSDRGSRDVAVQASAAAAAARSYQERPVVSEQPAVQAAPEYDGPPLDAYDDYVPYDDDGYGASADVPPWENPVSRTPITPEPKPEIAPSSTEDAASEPSVADLDAVLAFGFGAGVSFTEV